MKKREASASAFVGCDRRASVVRTDFAHQEKHSFTLRVLLKIVSVEVPKAGLAPKVNALKENLVAE